MSWHYSVQLKKGDFSALIINYPDNYKPAVIIDGKRFQPAWDYLGEMSRNWIPKIGGSCPIGEQEALRNLWVMATDNKWSKRFEVT